MFILQRGAIQMRTADGSLKLIPLHDVSMFTKKPAGFRPRSQTTGLERFIIGSFRRMSMEKIFTPCLVLTILPSTAIKNGWKY